MYGDSISPCFLPWILALLPVSGRESESEGMKDTDWKVRLGACCWTAGKRVKEKKKKRKKYVDKNVKPKWTNSVGRVVQRTHLRAVSYPVCVSIETGLLAVCFSTGGHQLAPPVIDFHAISMTRLEQKASLWSVPPLKTRLTWTSESFCVHSSLTVGYITVFFFSPMGYFPFFLYEILFNQSHQIFSAANTHLPRKSLAQNTFRFKARWPRVKDWLHVMLSPIYTGLVLSRYIGESDNNQIF